MGMDRVPRLWDHATRRDADFVPRAGGSERTAIAEQAGRDASDGVTDAVELYPIG
jgi:hypothetical protein